MMLYWRLPAWPTTHGMVSTGGREAEEAAVVGRFVVAWAADPSAGRDRRACPANLWGDEAREERGGRREARWVRGEVCGGRPEPSEGGGTREVERRPRRGHTVERRCATTLPGPRRDSPPRQREMEAGVRGGGLGWGATHAAEAAGASSAGPYAPGMVGLCGQVGWGTLHGPGTAAQCPRGHQGGNWGAIAVWGRRRRVLPSGAGVDDGGGGRGEGGEGSG